MERYRLPRSLPAIRVLCHDDGGNGGGGDGKRMEVDVEAESYEIAGYLSAKNREPSGGGDPANCHHNHNHNQHNGSFVRTHSSIQIFIVSDLENRAERIIFIRNGKISIVGAKIKIFNRKRLVKKA